MTPRCTDIGSSRVAIWNWLLNARTQSPGSATGRLAAAGDVEVAADLDLVARCRS